MKGALLWAVTDLANSPGGHRPSRSWEPQPAGTELLTAGRFVVRTADLALLRHHALPL